MRGRGSGALGSESFHPGAPAVCGDGPSPGQPLPARRPAVFRKLPSRSGALLDAARSHSDSEVESELEDDEALLALPLAGTRLKAAFVICLFAAVFFAEGASFVSSADSLSREFPASRVALLDPSEDADSEEEVGQSLARVPPPPILLALPTLFPAAPLGGLQFGALRSLAPCAFRDLRFLVCFL